jgi:hypothetical protein
MGFVLRFTLSSQVPKVRNGATSGVFFFFFFCKIAVHSTIGVDYVLYTSLYVDLSSKTRPATAWAWCVWASTSE